MHDSSHMFINAIPWFSYQWNQKLNNHFLIQLNIWQNQNDLSMFLNTHYLNKHKAAPIWSLIRSGTYWTSFRINCSKTISWIVVLSSQTGTISETTFSMDDQNTTTYNNNEHSKAIHQQKFKITDIKSVLFLWYTTPLFKFPLANLTTDEKSLLHKCSKVVTYMKCFIPSTCDLFSQQVSSTDDDYNQWLDNLHILCNNTQELVMSFIDTKHFEKYGTNLNPLVKHKARFDATYKLLETISKLEFPNNVALSDVIFTPATSLHPYYSNINQWETKKKSL